MTPFSTLLLKLAPFLFVLLWSSGSTVSKIGLQFSSVWTFLFLRSVVTCILLFFICTFMQKKGHLKGRSLFSNTKNSILAGIFLQFGYQAFLFLSISSGLSIGFIALILGVQPLLTPILAREKLAPKMIFILIAAFLGVILTIIGYKKMEGFTLLGFVFAIISVTSITIGSILQKKNSSHIFENLRIQFMTSSTLFGLSLFFGHWYLHFNPTFLFSLSWMILVVSLGANFLLIFMMKSHCASKVSSLFFCIPPVVMTLDYFCFSTRIAPISMVGTLLIMVSVKLYFSSVSAR